MLKRLLTFFIVGLLLAGCIKPFAPLPTSPATPVASHDLPGRIGDLPGYHVQLTNLLDDFAKGATVSLIDVATGFTKGASLANDRGEFLIRFGSSFTPARANPTDTRSVGYYLEAVKGVKGANQLPNQASADAVRLRTIVWFDFTQNGWVSLANSAPGGISISLSTSAVAFYINQQVVNGESVTPEAYIGSLRDTTAFPPPTDYLGDGLGVTGVRNLTSATYGTLFTQVTNAVVRDQDPLHAIVLNPDGKSVNTQVSFAVTAISTDSAPIGAALILSGLNFEPTNPNFAVVFVGEATASLDVPQCSASSLKLTVPPGARSGIIRVTLGGTNTYSEPFKVTTHDGHRAYFTDASGNTTLYAVSNSLGTLLRIDPDGSTTTLTTGLVSPQGVLVNPEGATSPPYSIYVANSGTGRVIRLNSSGTVLDANFLAVTNPSGLALGPEGDLYVTQTSANSLVRARVDWATGTLLGTKATYTGFTGPTSLAFDYSGYLYAVETSAGQVRRFKPLSSDTGTVAAPLEAWAYLSDPQGIAVDTGGSCFVTSQSNNVVYRVDPWRNVTSFAPVTTARSITRDEAGNLYVGDYSRSLVIRVTLAGDQRIYAYGLAGLEGLAVDGSSNLYVGLKNAGAVLKIASDGKTTSPLISGIAAPNLLTYRNGKLYISHTDNDSVTEVSLTGGARSAIPAGLRWPGGVEVSDDGATYYVGRFNEVNNSRDYSPPPKPIITIFDLYGLDVVNGGPPTLRKARTDGTTTSGSAVWSDILQAMWKLDADNVLIASDRQKQLLLMTTLNGQTGSQRLRDVTPVINGSKAFPSTIRDLVYDGSRYAYVACANLTIYRIDTQDYSAAPGTITGLGGTPYGMTMLGGNLYVVEKANKKIRRVSTPSTATNVDAEATWVATVGTDPLGIASYGGRLYVTDYTGKQVLRLDPATPGTVEVYISGLNGSPSRIRAYTDGRLLVRSSDWIYYTITTATPPVAVQTVSNMGCGGCDNYEYFIDGANNVSWTNYRWTQMVTAYGMTNTHELARDGTNPAGNILHVATYHGVYSLNLTTGDDYSVTGMGSGTSAPAGLAVNPTTHDLYVVNRTGTVYTVDPTTWGVTSRTSIPTTGYGLDYDAAAQKLYAAGVGDNSVYRIDPLNWAAGATRLPVGLHSPIF